MPTPLNRVAMRATPCSPRCRPGPGRIWPLRAAHLRGVLRVEQLMLPHQRRIESATSGGCWPLMWLMWCWSTRSPAPRPARGWPARAATPGARLRRAPGAPRPVLHAVQARQPAQQRAGGIAGLGRPRSRPAVRPRLDAAKSRVKSPLKSGVSWHLGGRFGRRPRPISAHSAGWS